MAIYVFETVDAGPMPGFTAADFIVFNNSSTTSSNVAVSNAALGTTLVANGKSVTFPEAAFAAASQSGQIVFSDGSSLLLGASSDDVITGSVDGEYLYGFAGADRLDGAQGHDVLLGGDGADTLIGGDGNDHLYGQSPSGGADGADLLLGGDGNDYLQGNAGADTLYGGDGSDRINGGGDNDLIFGDEGHDTVNGNLGADTIYGGGGNDFLRGGQGNDSILGGEGNDQLFGDLGDDTVVGGAGLDVLTGGAGTDLFRFAAGDAGFSTTGALANVVDIIVDYADGTDRFALGFAPAAVLNGGVQASFAGAAAYAQQLVTGNPGGNEVAAIRVGADTYLFFGGSGGDAIDSAIKLNGVDQAVIGTSDFI